MAGFYYCLSSKGGFTLRSYACDTMSRKEDTKGHQYKKAQTAIKAFY